MVTVLWTGSDRFGQVRTGVKHYFSSTVRCTLAKFGLPFEKATPLVHFPKALERPRNNVGPARRQKAIHLGRLNMQFQHDWPKDKQITALLSFCLKTEKFRSTELYGAPLEGSTIFLYRSSTGRTALVSSGLAGLKYAFFSSTGRNTKNYGPRTFFN